MLVHGVRWASWSYGILIALSCKAGLESVVSVNQFLSVFLYKRAYRVGLYTVIDAL